jgi:hypothetical protein
VNLLMFMPISCAFSRISLSIRMLVLTFILHTRIYRYALVSI